MLKNVSVRNLRDSGIRGEFPEIMKYRAAARKRGVNYAKLAVNDKLDIGHGVNLEVLAPSLQPLFEKTNDRSLVLKLTYGDVSVILPGDAEIEEEKWLVDNCAESLKCDILKSPHHGSSTSVYEPFLGLVNPEVVVISCAMVNKFGHPHSETLAKYRKRSYKVYRTDYNGTITITTNGDQYKIETEKQ